MQILTYGVGPEILHFKQGSVDASPGRDFNIKDIEEAHTVPNKGFLN